MNTKLHFWFSQKQADLLRLARSQMPSQKHVLTDGLAKLESGQVVQYTEASPNDSKSHWPDAVNLGLGEIYSIDGVKT